MQLLEVSEIPRNMSCLGVFCWTEAEFHSRDGDSGDIKFFVLLFGSTLCYQHNQHQLNP